MNSMATAQVFLKTELMLSEKRLIIVYSKSLEMTGLIEILRKSPTVSAL
jgi:hypothetical protein